MRDRVGGGEENHLNEMGVGEMLKTGREIGRGVSF